MQFRSARRLLPLLLIAAGCTSNPPDADSTATGPVTLVPIGSSVSASEGAIDNLVMPLAAPGYQLCDVTGSSDRILVWQNVENLFGKAMEEQLAEFSAATGVAVEVVPFEGEAQMLEKLAKATPEEWPDFVVAHETVGRAIADSGRLVRPASCEPAIEDRLQVLAVELNSVDGALASVPLWMSLPMLYYDANKVRAAGLDPDAPPTTFEQIVGWSEKLVQSGASPYGLAINDTCGEMVLKHQALPGQAADPGDGSDSDGRGSRVSLSRETLAAAVSDLQSLRDGVVDGDVVFFPTDETGFSDLIAIGNTDVDAALAMHTSASVRPVLDSVSTLYTQVDVRLAPFPGGGVPGTVSLWQLSDGDPQRAGGAWVLADWLTQRGQGARWSVTTGLISAVAGVASETVLTDAWKSAPQLRSPYDALEALSSRHGQLPQVQGPWLQIMNATTGLCVRVMNGEVDPDTAVRMWVDDVNNAIDAYEVSRFAGDPAIGKGELELNVVCDNGADVAGVWIQAFGSQSGFAEEMGQGVFRFTIDAEAPYVAHVGCGEIDGRWASSDWSPVLIAREVGLECDGSDLTLPGRCSPTG